MRAFGTCAFIMLTLILCIGPLARLDRRFLPLLYNRRHLGVATFALGLLHAGLGLAFYHGFGRVSPLVSILTSSAEYGSASAFPFEILGLVALVILFLMAATSHDFWLKNLSPAIWKGLHMLGYLAWGLLVMHVALGAAQSERNPVYVVLLIVAVAAVAGLHVVAARPEVRRDRVERAIEDGWIDACPVDEIAEDHGIVIAVKGRERVAIFRHGNRLSAVSNVCAHQAGPLGEGRIIDGCITCPWHGYQYRPHDGCAPPPFTEKLPTFRLRVENGRVMLQVQALPPGTPVEPVDLSQVSEVSHA
jgi:nitrite reductase/ring-hydroxylating ferredoxin subunit/DMSO/TMAO reductase YedYZ heme-binding membrane subunit